MRKYASVISLVVLAFFLGPPIAISIVVGIAAIRDWRNSKISFTFMLDISDLERRLLHSGPDIRREALVALHHRRRQLEPSDLRMLLRLACELPLNESDRSFVMKILSDSMGLYESELVEVLNGSPECAEATQVQDIIVSMLARWDPSYRAIDRDSPDWVERICELFDARKREGRAW